MEVFVKLTNLFKHWIDNNNITDKKKSFLYSIILLYNNKNVVVLHGQDFCLLQGHQSVYPPFFLINCVCHSISSMFRVLGIYNFGSLLNSIYFIRLQLVINERKWMEGSNSGSIYKVPWKKWKRNFLYCTIFPLFFFFVTLIAYGILYFAFIHFFSFSLEFCWCISRLIFKLNNLFMSQFLKTPCL